MYKKPASKPTSKQPKTSNDVLSSQSCRDVSPRPSPFFLDLLFEEAGIFMGVFKLELIFRGVD